VREAIGAMQNSLTGWHPANRIRGVCRRLYKRGAVMNLGERL
jgi:hypothetical protein